MKAMLSIMCWGVAALTLAAWPARSDVIWTFIETSCTSLNGHPGCLVPPLPAPIATLTLPDINASGIYHLSEFASGPATESGDTNFRLDWGFIVAPPPTHTCENCTWDIGFASSPTALTIAIDYSELTFSQDIHIHGTNLISSGFLGSDSEMPGCGFFQFCNTVTGTWALTVAVPEASSLAILAGALIGACLLTRWRIAPIS